MLQLAVCLRAMQLFAHHAHNLVARTPFFSDHQFFGDAYSAYESDYDSIIERIIGLQGESGLDLGMILSQVAAKLQGAPGVGVKENSAFYSHLLMMEQTLCKLVNEQMRSVPMSEGTKQLIGEICNQSEIRQYKIKQRLKK